MKPIRLTWPGGEHDFALPLGELRALQDATCTGPEDLFNRLRLGTWRVDDTIHILRCGLIGGGMSREKAAFLVSGLVELHTLASLKLAAAAVIRHALLGPEDDPVGKPDGAEMTPPPDDGNSRASTAPAS